MKKKAIEKIPYFGLKKTSRKKDVKYIGVTAVKIPLREHPCCSPDDCNFDYHVDYVSHSFMPPMFSIVKI